MPFGKGYMDAGTGEGRMPRTQKQKTMSQNSRQPSNSGMPTAKGAFGKGGGKGTMVDGVMFDGDAGGTTKNGGNYNEVMSSAKKFV